MELLVKRDRFTSLSTSGELFVNGAHRGWTLEPPKLEGDVKPRAIPAARYRVKLAFSPEHKRILPLVVGVPGFSGVEIHIGNFPKDTKACLLVGEERAPDQVLESTLDFNALFEEIHAAVLNQEDVWITYEDCLDPAAAAAAPAEATS